LGFRELRTGKLGSLLFGKTAERGAAGGKRLLLWLSLICAGATGSADTAAFQKIEVKNKEETLLLSELIPMGGFRPEEFLAALLKT
jgi:hypothetical protein